MLSMNSMSKSWIMLQYSNHMLRKHLLGIQIIPIERNAFSSLLTILISLLLTILYQSSIVQVIEKANLHIQEPDSIRINRVITLFFKDAPQNVFRKIPKSLNTLKTTRKAVQTAKNSGKIWFVEFGHSYSHGRETDFLVNDGGFVADLERLWYMWCDAVLFLHYAKCQISSASSGRDVNVEIIEIIEIAL